MMTILRVPILIVKGFFYLLLALAAIPGSESSRQNTAMVLMSLGYTLALMPAVLCMMIVCCSHYTHGTAETMVYGLVLFGFVLIPGFSLNDHMNETIGEQGSNVNAMSFVMGTVLAFALANWFNWPT